MRLLEFPCHSPSHPRRRSWSAYMRNDIIVKLIQRIKKRKQKSFSTLCGGSFLLLRFFLLLSRMEIRKISSFFFFVFTFAPQRMSKNVLWNFQVYILSGLHFNQISPQFSSNSFLRNFSSLYLRAFHFPLPCTDMRCDTHASSYHLHLQRFNRKWRWSQI